MIQKIIINKDLLAIIIKKESNPKKNGANFITDKNSPLQLGFINYPKNHIIKPHFHPKRKKIIYTCPEVLIVKEGTMLVFFYSKNNKKVSVKKKLQKGDIILLLKGGHSFKVLKKINLIEIKQGPYSANKDKKIIK